MEPKSPYRKWLVEENANGHWNLVAVEPDGTRLVMRPTYLFEEAQNIAFQFTDVERRAQLARENPNPEER